MRRRSFVAALPLAAAGMLTGLGSEVSAQEGTSSPKASGDAALPKFQAAGEERFVRPDVHAGDRPLARALRAGRRRWAARARRERRTRLRHSPQLKC